MTNADLQYWYWYYNRKYFGGKLPFFKVSFRRLPQEWEAFGITEFEKKEITLDLGTRKHATQAKLTLLHEMVHVSLSDEHVPHGKKFQAGMLRLAKLGAFKNLW